MLVLARTLLSLLPSHISKLGYQPILLENMTFKASSKHFAPAATGVPAMPFAGLSSDNMLLAHYGVSMREVEGGKQSIVGLSFLEGGVP